MSALEATIITSLSVDHLASILAYLTPKEICHLLLLGHDRLYQLVIGSTTSLCVSLAVRRPFKFPPILGRFSRLTSLQIAILYSAHELNVSEQDFSALPPSLTCFTFDAGVAKLKTRSSGHTSPLPAPFAVDLASRLPSLTTFLWRHYRPFGGKAGPQFHALLSPNLTSLNLLDCYELPSSCIVDLPRSIIHLALNVTDTEAVKADFLLFPPNLIQLRLKLHRPHDLHLLHALPSCLEHLTVFSDDLDEKTTKLLPRGLLLLRAPFEPFNESIALALPPKLMTLHVRCSFPYHSNVYPLLPRSLTDFFDWNNPLSFYLTVENVMALPRSLKLLPTHLMGPLPPSYWIHLPRDVSEGNFKIAPTPGDPLLPVHFNVHLPRFLNDIRIENAEPWMIPLLPTTLQKLNLGKFATPTGNFEAETEICRISKAPVFAFDPIWINRFPRLHTLGVRQPILWRNMKEVKVQLRTLQLGAAFNIQEAFNGTEDAIFWAQRLENAVWFLNFDISAEEAARQRLQNGWRNFTTLYIGGPSIFASHYLEALPRTLESFVATRMNILAPLGRHLALIPPKLRSLQVDKVSIMPNGSPKIEQCDVDLIPNSLDWVEMTWDKAATLRFGAKLSSDTALLANKVMVCNFIAGGD